MKIKADRLFGIPFSLCKIDPKSYNKEELIDNHKSNYLKNPNRNKWREDNLNIHHSYGDWDNPDFIKPDYSQLIKVYEEVIPKCLEECGLVGDYKFSFDIVNYNCMSDGGYMSAHQHIQQDFVGIHYIQFDTENHQPTLFFNEHPFANYQEDILPHMKKLVNPNSLYTSCFNQQWQLGIEEDDYCIVPGFLKHEVPVQPKSGKLRMAISTNIEVWCQ